MENFPSSELVKQCLDEFQENPPLYRYIEAEDDYYTVYMIEDAAVDALNASGFTAINEPLFRQYAELLATAASQEIKNYSRILKMRFALQSELNRHVRLNTVDQQG